MTEYQLLSICNNLQHTLVIRKIRVLDTSCAKWVEKKEGSGM